MGSLYTVAALDGQTKHHLEETIRSMASDAKNFCVMCVGHNKGWEEVSEAMVRQSICPAQPIAGQQLQLSLFVGCAGHQELGCVVCHQTCFVLVCPREIGVSKEAVTPERDDMHSQPGCCVRLLETAFIWLCGFSNCTFC